MPAVPVHVMARWKIKEGNKQTVLKLLKELHSETIKEKGNLFYMIHQSVTDANTLIIFEGYTNEITQKEHVNSAHFKKLAVEQIIPLLEEREE
jgi:quinol monooxygenase YgiN